MGNSATTRNGFLDCLRFVASLGIIIFHIGMPFGSVALSALSFFTAILCYFAALYRGENSFEFQLNRINSRIGLPWMAWCVIYLAAKLLDAQLAGLPYTSQFESYMWWTGPSLHLWYLPFALTMTLLITQFIAPIKVGTTVFGLMLISLIVVCFVCGFGVGSKSLGIPWIQWTSVLPGSLFGLSLAAASGRFGRTLALAVGICFGAATVHGLGYSSFAVQIAVGGFAALIAVSWNPGSNKISNWLGSVSLGIYLAHPLSFAIVRKFTDQDTSWSTFFLTASLSIVTAEIYRRMEILLKQYQKRLQLDAEHEA